MPGDPVTLSKPWPLKTTLPDGTVVVGPITRWDDVGFDATVDGTARRYRWDDLRPLETYRVRKRLIQDSKGDPKGEGKAEGGSEGGADGGGTRPGNDDRRARTLDLFIWFASRDDADLTARCERDARAAGADDAAISAARDAAAAARAEREAKAAAARQAALRRGSPEGDTFDPAPWPMQSADDRARRIVELKAMAAAKLASAGRESTGIEGRHAIVYSDLGATDAATRAVDLDHFIAGALPRLGISSEVQPFWGKVVVIVVDGEDRHRLLEAAGFRQEVSARDVVLTHYDGGRTFVVVRAQRDVVETSLAMYRGVALGLLHSYVSATRLPPWANEGLADWLVAMYPSGKPCDAPLRRAGLRFLRGGGSIEGVLSLTYAEGSWPGPEGIGRPVGFLLAGFMAEHEPRRFQEWVRAVKAGKPWKQALVEDFGLTPAALVEAARRYYRTND